MSRNESAQTAATDQHEADEIETARFLTQPPAVLDCRLGLAQDQRDRRDREQADRAVDQKAPVPGEIIGQPTAERRPGYRSDHHRNPEQREGLAALRWRKGIRQNRLRHRHHAAATEALQDAEQ
jgi:hypothetical protein